jgi:DNA repair photolyase
MIVKEVKCKSLLNLSKLADYCINPYVGCSHNCVYCYADYLTRKFTRHEEKWGDFVDVKTNAPEILRKEVLRKSKGTVFISSLTDPYQPLEKKYELTRKILEILLRSRFPVSVQTKSSLVIRDVDLLKKFKECEVGFTITTLDENVRKVFEPFSSSVDEKIEALQLLQENRIKTYVFFGPVLPYLSVKSFKDYFENLSHLTSYFFVDKLNLKPGTWARIEKVLEDKYPELTRRWKEIFFEGSDYYQRIKQEIYSISKKNEIKVVFCY